jgi:methylase of polypeptide subunit release factors
VQTQDYPDAAREEVHALFARPPRRLLDTGCASGAVAAGVKRADPGTWAWGCELNPHAAAIAGQRLDHVTTLPIEQWSPQDIERLRSVDTVLLLDVLSSVTCCRARSPMPAKVSWT